MSYILPTDALGYPAGTELRDVPLLEARSWECNRCGGCCAGDLDDETVLKDEATGLPLFNWGSRFPDDLYESRYGVRMLQPLVMSDGGVSIGEAFEQDANDKPYTAFRCSFFSQEADGCGSCGLRAAEPDPENLATLRPRACGEFPIFGLDVDASIIEHGSFVPPVGSLPKCTWYGIRVTGPWKNEPIWREQFAAQQENLNG